MYTYIFMDRVKHGESLKTNRTDITYSRGTLATLDNAYTHATGVCARARECRTNTVSLRNTRSVLSNPISDVRFAGVYTISPENLNDQVRNLTPSCHIFDVRPFTNDVSVRVESVRSAARVHYVLQCVGGISHNV